MYQIALISVVCLAIVSLTADPGTKIVMLSLSTTIGSLGCILIIFAPKLLKLGLTKAEATKLMQQGMEGKTTTSTAPAGGYMCGSEGPRV